MEDRLLIEEIRAYVDAGDLETARNRLNVFIDQYPNSSYFSLAKRLLQQIESTHPTKTYQWIDSLACFMLALGGLFSALGTQVWTLWAILFGIPALIFGKRALKQLNQNQYLLGGALSVYLGLLTTLVLITLSLWELLHRYSDNFFAISLVLAAVIFDLYRARFPLTRINAEPNQTHNTTTAFRQDSHNQTILFYHWLARTLSLTGIAVAVLGLGLYSKPGGDAPALLTGLLSLQLYLTVFLSFLYHRPVFAIAGDRIALRTRPIGGLYRLQLSELKSCDFDEKYLTLIDQNEQPYRLELKSVAQHDREILLNWLIPKESIEPTIH